MKFRKYKKLLFVLMILICVFFVVETVGADGLKDWRTKLAPAAHEAGYDINTTDLNKIIQVVITSLLSFLGVIFLILMIYGGFLWMTDRGNTEQVEKAKKLLTAAVIGLVIVISAYAISIFVVETMTKDALTAPPTNATNP